MRNLPMIAVFAVAVGLSACSGGSGSDAAITTTIKQQLSDQHLPGSIGVTTEKGVVTLSGAVPDVLVKQHAEGIAKTTGGVQYVVNNLHTTMAGDAPLQPHDIPHPGVPNVAPPGGIPPQIVPPDGMNVPPPASSNRQ